MIIMEIAQTVGNLLIAKKMTLGVCESCTGGMLGSIITQVPGSSRYFKGGIIAYSNVVKKEIVGVKTNTLKKYGAVSAHVAREMAQGVRMKFKSHVGIGITGIAGPGGGSKKKPVGLVYIGCVIHKKNVFKELLFKGTRDQIRRRACKEALLLLKRMLQKENS